MYRYGINFWDEKRDVTASVYFESNNGHFAAEREAKAFQKEGWVAGQVFFIDEKDWSYYVPVETFLKQESFEFCYEVIRESQKKVLMREAYELTAMRIVSTANNSNGYVNYSYKRVKIS